MRIFVIKKIEELYNAREEWNRLISKCPQATVFQTWEWTLRWWETFSHDKNLFVLMFRDDQDEVVAIAPLYKTRRRIGIRKMRCIEFLGLGEMENSEYLDFIISAGNENETIKCFLNYIDKERKEWDCIYLTNNRSSSAIANDLSGLLDTLNHPWLKENNLSCPYIELPSDMDAMLKRFKPKARGTIRNQCNKLFKKHNVRIYKCAEKDDVEKTVDLLFELHRIRFGDSSVFYSDNNRIFIKAVSKDLLEKDMLRLFVLEIDGEPAAALYGLRYENTFIDYQKGYNTKWMKMNASKVLLCKTIESAIDDKAGVFDFGRGTEAYKFQWSKKKEDTYDYMIFKNKLEKIFYDFPKKTYRLLKPLFKK